MFPSSLCRILPLLAAVGTLTLASAPPLQAKASDAGGDAPIDVNFFYDTLKDDGSWYNTSEYGDVWQPYIAYKSDTWRPYTDGYWSYTDGGWMFVSNENFGWAVYHYGRWTRLKDIGWAWVPGTDWAPAWVTWRASKPGASGPPAGPDGSTPGAASIDATSTTQPPVADDKNAPPDESAPPRSAASARPAGDSPRSDNYVGWAPLPPEPAGYATDYSYGPAVDVNLGIDPYDYCFTDVRYFGAPYVAAVIFDPFDSFYYADRSVNITNVYYDRSGPYRGFYAGGPDYNRFRGVTQRPIPQYNLHQTGGRAAEAAVRAGQFNRIKGNNLAVPAPQFSKANVGPGGRVTMTRAGALAKAEVSHGAPAAAANNPAYKTARESFAKQGDSFRAAHPEATTNRPAAVEGGGAVPETGPRITTTARAQEEERAARQAAGEKEPGPVSREEALKEHGAGGVNTAAENKGSEPKATEARHDTAATEGTRHAGKGIHHGSTREVEGRGTEERRSTPVSREREVESSGRGHGGGPRAAQITAPRMVAPAPRPQAGGGGGGGGGNKGDDKKKK